MAGTAYTSFAVGDPNINAVMLNLAGINTGYNALTLTQMSTTTVPAIAAGSKIEVGGTLFKFDTDEAISGSPSDGTVYIMLVPSGSSITAQFTNTAPTWSDSKQGWYGTGGSAGNRYAGSVVKSGSSYTDKGVLINFGGLPLTVGINGLVITTFNSFTASQLTIRKLNMYSYGDLAVGTLNNAQNLYFTAVRPCYIYNIGPSTIYRYAMGEWREYAPSAAMRSAELPPGVYRILGQNGYTCYIRLLAAVGLTTLTLSDTLINISIS